MSQFAPRRSDVVFLMSAPVFAVDGDGLFDDVNFTGGVIRKDVPGVWSGAAPTQFFMPSGFTEARLSFHAEFEAGVAGADIRATQTYDGATIPYGTSQENRTGLAAGTTHISGFSAWVAITAGKAFVWRLSQESGLPVNIKNSSWLQLEFR